MTTNAGPRVIFYGEYGCGNLGNEASLDVVLDWVRGAGPSQIEAIAREPEVVTAEHGIPTARMYADRAKPRFLPSPARKAIGKVADPVRIARLLRPGDVVLVAGTGVLEEKLSGAPWGLPLSMMGLAWAVRARRARLGMIGIGASADSRRPVRWMTRQLLRGVTYLSFRDRQSKDGMLADRMPVANSQVFPDVAFAARRDESEQSPWSPGGPLRVGVGVLAYYDPVDVPRGAAVAQRYEAETLAFCHWLVAQGHHVQLLVGDASDVPLAESIHQSVSARHGDGGGSQAAGSIEFHPPTVYQDLLQTMRALDVVIGARFHNVIFGLWSGLPVLGVEYAEKTRALLEAVGLAQYVVAIENVDRETLQRLFTDLVDNYDTNRRCVDDFRRQAAEASDEHRQQVRDFLADRRSSSGR